MSSKKEKKLSVPGSDIPDVIELLKKLEQMQQQQNETNKQMKQQQNETNKQLLDRLDRIERQITDKNWPVLPLSIERDLMILENDLKEIKERLTDKLELEARKGVDPQNSTKNVLNQLMTMELASSYNWTGVKEKKAFKDLRLVEHIQRAVRTKFPDAENSVFEKSITKFLNDAHKKAATPSKSKK